MMVPRSLVNVVRFCAALTIAGASQGPLPSADGERCYCASEEALDKDCCNCTGTQVAEATSTYFKGILTELVETSFFRLYTPYPEQSGKELYDVQCSVSEFKELEEQLSESQIGCAIEQCGCQESECAVDHWRREPCFVKCEESARAREESVRGIVRTVPVVSNDEGPVQYDLLQNPEQFTGYGTLLDDRSASMIWENLYTDQFCFASCPQEAASHLSPEKRLVYRVVSGLQASINTHLAMHYGLYADSGEPATRQTWTAGRDLHFGPWKALFDDRVGGHPDRVRNMHFVFALLLRAVRKLHPHMSHVLEAGRTRCEKCASQHNTTRDLLYSLVLPHGDESEACDAVLNAFDDSALFAAGDTESLALLEEVKLRFQRMGEMMTCVGCDRCKLWGTLQFHAARVAIGILTSSDAGAGSDTDARSPYAVRSIPDLRPNDVVALVNALAQVSKSVDQAKKWMDDVTTTIGA